MRARTAGWFLVSALVAPLLAVAGVGAGPGAAGAARGVVDAGTLLATVALSPSGLPGTAGSVRVIAEPALGRVEVRYRPAADVSDGRYLHVRLGAWTGASCSTAAVLVVDTEGVAAPAAHDAGGDARPVSDLSVDDVVRVETDPLPALDCVDVGTHDLADPLEPGAAVTLAAAEDLVPLVYDEQHLPVRLECPSVVDASDTFVVSLGYPSAAEALSYGPLPSTVAIGDLELRGMGDTTVVSEPALPGYVDLWTAEGWAGDFVLRPGPDLLYTLRSPHALMVVDDAPLRRGCFPIDVTHPAPTGWEGSLAGQTWWHRAPRLPGDRRQVRHAYEFVDDEWAVAWLGVRGYRGPATRRCTEAGEDGCRRYYYDAATGRLQIDGTRARPLADGRGWQLPDTPHTDVMPVFDHDQPFRTDRVVLPAETGMRLDYRGVRSGGTWLRLRPDGTYRRSHQGRVTTGRYRFVGGAKQLLVLRRPGADFREPVLLFFGGHGRRLLDLVSRSLDLQRR